MKDRSPELSARDGVGFPVIARGELGTSPAARRVEELLPRISERADTVLIIGESGVGKERVAQMLHRLRETDSRAPFIA